MPEPETPANEPAKEDDLTQLVRRSLLGAQHLKDIEEHARELVRKGAKISLPEARAEGTAGKAGA